MQPPPLYILIIPIGRNLSERIFVDCSENLWSVYLSQVCATVAGWKGSQRLEGPRLTMNHHVLFDAPETGRLQNFS